jgi:hypothetical protein
MSQDEPPQKSVVWLLGVACVVLGANTLEPVAAYLEHRWPLIGLGGSLFIVLMLTAHNRETEWTDRLARFNWVLLAAYLLHGFEVDGVDLYGREFYFLEYAKQTRGMNLNPVDILRMNTVAIWLILLCAVWGGERLRWTGLAGAGVVLANGLLHTGNALALGEYNPGLATSLALFLPLSVAYYRHALNALGVSRWEVAGGVLFGLAGHALLPILISQHMPLSILVFFAFLPLGANAAASLASGRNPTQRSTARPGRPGRELRSDRSSEDPS